MKSSGKVAKTTFFKMTENEVFQISSVFTIWQMQSNFHSTYLCDVQQSRQKVLKSKWESTNARSLDGTCF
jgi:hypothetical protein